MVCAVARFAGAESFTDLRRLAPRTASWSKFFVATSWLAVKMDARPSESASVLSQIASGAFPAGSFVVVDVHLDPVVGGESQRHRRRPAPGADDRVPDAGPSPLVDHRGAERGRRSHLHPSQPRVGPR